MSDNSAIFWQALSFSLFVHLVQSVLQKLCMKVHQQQTSAKDCMPYTVRKSEGAFHSRKSRVKDANGVTDSSVQGGGWVQPHSHAFQVTSPPPRGRQDPWARRDVGRCGMLPALLRSPSSQHPRTYRLAMPAFRTAVEMALMAVQRELRSWVNSPVPFARLPSSITKRVMVMTLVSKAERSVMVAATAECSDSCRRRH